jgi:hypothetical protein
MKAFLIGLLMAAPPSAYRDSVVVERHVVKDSATGFGKTQPAARTQAIDNARMTLPPESVMFQVLRESYGGSKEHGWTCSILFSYETK